MGSEKPNFLSQPVVKNVFMFRNGDPHYDARRIVINQKRVSNFDTLLREVSGGIQAPFGAVRNIYTPRGGHKVDCLESLRSGEQYVAAGRERFKKLDYIHIGSRKRRLLQTLPMHAKPLPPTRIIVSARFLKPIKEPCTIFVVANGDVLNPAVRLLIHQRMLGQFERILETITEKMGLKVLGGVRSLFTYEGHQVTEGSQLESGQLYVAVGRDRFKKLPYSDLLFSKPRGTRRVNGVKAYTLPPIYRFSKQNGNSKSVVRCSDSGDGDFKASPPGHNGNNKEHLSSIVREISQARLLSLRKKRSGQSMTLTVSDHDDQESKADDGNTDDKAPQEQPAEEKPADDDSIAAEENSEKSEEQKPPDEDSEAAEENSEKSEEQEEAAAEITKEEEEEEEEDASASKADQEENQETNGEREGDEEKKGDVEPSEKEEEATAEPEEKEDENKEEVESKEEVENKEEVKAEEQRSSGSNSDKSQDSAEKEDGSHASSEGEKDEQGKHAEEEKQDKVSEEGEKNSEDENNDVDVEEEQKATKNDSDPEKTQSDNETKDGDNDQSSSGNSNQEEDVSETKEEATKGSGKEERKENGEVGGAEDDELESELELDTEDTNSAGPKDTAANGETGEGLLDESS
ncbi:doublecortin domain-containing protein 2-like [Pleuronectes platessa]|uniref:doublecortin domain-containing protein 2-like n=1 Tax=Pleuronectes platessa TaxID=8262 RepID=UPI00232A318A|nr:doublecortin domain-containing protein 2-like [Pleuronectes platessa]